MADALVALNSSVKALNDVVTAAGGTGTATFPKEAAISADANANLAVSNLGVLQAQSDMAKKQAQNADALDQTRVTMDQQYAGNALSALNTSLTATQNMFGAAQTLAKSVVDMTTQKAQLEDNKPSFFKNPFGWFADSIKIGSLEDDIATRTADATNAFNQASAVSAAASQQFQDLTAIHKLQTSVALDAQATELNKGMREQAAAIDTATKQNAIIAAANDKQYAMAKDVADYHVKELTASVEQQKVNQLKTQNQLLLEKKAQRDAGIEQMVSFLSKTKGIPITPVLKQTAADYYDALGNTAEGSMQRAAIFDLNARTQQYPDKQSMVTGLLSTGTVGDIRVAGNVMQDSVLAQLGDSAIVSRQQEIFASLMSDSYRAATGKNSAADPVGFNNWLKIFPKDQKDQITQQAQQLAANEILHKPVTDFARENLALKANAIPLNASVWGNPDYLEKTYGIAKESKASKVMSDPAVQLQIKTATDQGGQDSTVESVYSLHKNFVSNGMQSIQENAKLISDIYKRNAAAQNYGGNSNAVYTYLKSKGLVAQPVAKLTYDGKSYDLTLPSDVENLLVRKDKNVKEDSTKVLDTFKLLSGSTSGFTK